MNNILFITFDYHEKNKPIKSVAVATLEAYIKYNIDNTNTTSFSFNMNDEESILFKQMSDLHDNAKFGYSHVCLSMYAWNMRFVDSLLDLVKAKQRRTKIVAGGYEVNTMCINRLIKDFPLIDHYIIGYAELSLALLISKVDNSRVLNNTGDGSFEILPVNSIIFNLNSVVVDCVYRVA